MTPEGSANIANVAEDFDRLLAEQLGIEIRASGRAIDIEDDEVGIGHDGLHC